MCMLPIPSQMLVFEMCSDKQPFWLTSKFDFILRGRVSLCIYQCSNNGQTVDFANISNRTVCVFRVVWGPKAHSQPSLVCTFANIYSLSTGQHDTLLILFTVFFSLHRRRNCVNPEGDSVQSSSFESWPCSYECFLWCRHSGSFCRCYETQNLTVLIITSYHWPGQHRAEVCRVTLRLTFEFRN